jgi:hypothetical protein
VKYLLAILLSVSLYTPDIAKLIAYVDYAVDIASSEKINLCDCKDVLAQQSQPENHQQHMGQAETEWKYIITEMLTIPAMQVDLKTEPIAGINNKLHHISFDIFQPPRV